MYFIATLEIKDCPTQLGQREFNEEGESASLIFHIYNALFCTGNINILYSGFYVLKPIIALKNYDFFASALIKKVMYGPKFING